MPQWTETTTKSIAGSCLAVAICAVILSRRECGRIPLCGFACWAAGLVVVFPVPGGGGHQRFDLVETVFAAPGPADAVQRQGPGEEGDSDALDGLHGVWRASIRAAFSASSGADMVDPRFTERIDGKVHAV
jgi:hypothetical protein